MTSFLTLKEGIYDPLRRFAFTNITDEPFTFHWDGRPYTVNAGDTVELPHHLAILATGQLVDQIMLKEVKQDEIAHSATPYYRSPRGTDSGIPALRKPYEDKILKELEVDQNASQFKILQAQALDELKKDFNAEPAKPITKVSVSPDEFSQLNKK